MRQFAKGFVIGYWAIPVLLLVILFLGWFFFGPEEMGEEDGS